MNHLASACGLTLYILVIITNSFILDAVAKATVAKANSMMSFFDCLGKCIEFSLIEQRICLSNWTFRINEKIQASLCGNHIDTSIVMQHSLSNLVYFSVEGDIVTKFVSIL